jgi:hypothetical protein
VFVREWLKPFLETTCARPDCDWQISRKLTVTCSTCRVVDARASKLFRGLVEQQRFVEGY